MSDAASNAIAPDLADAADTAADERRDRMLDVLRDVVRGGLSGLIAGVLVVGIGGRLVMRLAALIVPGAEGALTENGDRIGDITIGGTAALVVFVGLPFGVAVGSLWVTIRAFLPSAAAARAAVSVPIGIALGATVPIDPHNRDFAILDRDPLVVASLVILVGLVGPAVVVVEGWFESRLPRPTVSDRTTIGSFAVMASVGLLLFVVGVIPLYLSPDLRPVGVALVVVGVATLATWVARTAGRSTPAWALLVGRMGLAAAALIGLALFIPDLQAVLQP